MKKYITKSNYMLKTEFVSAMSLLIFLIIPIILERLNPSIVDEVSYRILVPILVSLVPAIIMGIRNTTHFEQSNKFEIEILKKSILSIVIYTIFFYMLLMFTIYIMTPLIGIDYGNNEIIRIMYNLNVYNIIVVYTLNIILRK